MRLQSPDRGCREGLRAGEEKGEGDTEASEGDAIRVQVALTPRG